ncbi:hypothetical protein HY498_02725 [Candidatus Woesearchaeota archaeon]|nr:hypothetical protein [Candidatus Woesearchaeota archaeon]
MKRFVVLGKTGTIGKKVVNAEKFFKELGESYFKTLNFVAKGIRNVYK